LPFRSALLAHRRIFWIAVAAGMLLACSSLRVGFFMDDYAFVTWLDGKAPKRVTPFDLYEFGRGDRAANFEMVRRGPWPWWTDLDLKVRFFRPLSSALLWTDHALFGHAAMGYHLHALLWYLALLVGAGIMLRSALSPPVYALAFLMYALAGGHGEPVGWISARHMLVAAAPAVAGLAAHVAYRERDFRAGRWLAAPGMLVGLAGGEAALGALLYWISYEAVGAPEGATWGPRLRRMSLPLGITGAYFAAYKVAGYGAAHSGAYFEPFAEPARFARIATERFPLLLGELLGATSAEMAQVFSPAPFIAAGVLAVVAFGALVRAVWPAVPADDRRALRWLGLGAVLATFVTVGGFPGSRLLLLPGIGGCAYFAAVVVYAAKRLAEPTLGHGIRAGIRAGRVFLVVAHLVLSPLLFLAGVGMVAEVGGATARIDRELDGVLGGEAASTSAPRRVLILAASDPAGGLYVGAARALRAPQAVSSWLTLSMARATHHIERVDQRRLVISAEPGMLHGNFEVVFRGADRPLRPGDRVDLDDVSVTVLTTEDRFPTSIEVEFRSISMDDSSVVLLVWREEKLVPVRLALGESIDVPWSKGPTGFF
jgi:hypothetical protein